MGKRRGAKEESIYRRKDGRYVGQYEVEGERRYWVCPDRTDDAGSTESRRSPAGACPHLGERR